MRYQTFCIMWLYNEEDTVRNHFYMLCEKHNRDFLRIKDEMAKRFSYTILQVIEKNKAKQVLEKGIPVFEVIDGKISEFPITCIN